MLSAGMRIGSYEIVALLGAGGMGEVFRGLRTRSERVAALRSPNRGVYLQPFPATGAVYQVPQQRLDFHPVWSRDGRELLFVPSAASGQVAGVTVTREAGVTFGGAASFAARVTGDRVSSERRAYDILPDGRFVGLVSTAEMGRFTSIEVRVVLNWFEELRQRVPVP